MTLDWVLVPLGFLVGLVGTLIGAGGGFLLVPALLVLYPTANPATITSISLAVVFANAAAGSVALARERWTDYHTGLIFAAATVPGAVLGALAVAFIPRALFTGLFGVLLLILALVVILRPRRGGTAGRMPEPGMLTRVIVDATGTRHEYHYHLWQGILLSLGAGFLSSLLGIGGGIVYVPAMVLLLDLPTQIATATSQFILAITALAGTSVHLATGELAFGAGLRRALVLASGVIPGAFVGAHLARRMRGRVIIRLLGVALALVGLRLLLSAITD
jgi:uncharacterized membrane protein YfcA